MIVYLKSTLDLMSEVDVAKQMEYVIEGTGKVKQIGDIFYLIIYNK